MPIAETPLARTRRARRIYRDLHDTYPYAHCELDFETPLQLLVATILSAQSTDVGVNKVTPALFARYRTAGDYANADRAELETLVKSTGFFRAKSDALIKLGMALQERYAGEVPGKLKDLVTLPGVGRKTANVVLGNAFGVPGITVDTHFGRLARRWEWTVEEDPVKVEAEVGAPHPQAGLDDALARRHLPWAPDVPRPQTCVRCLSDRTAVPGIRHWGDGSGAGGGVAEVRTRTRCGRFAGCGIAGRGIAGRGIAGCGIARGLGMTGASG